MEGGPCRFSCHLQPRRQRTSNRPPPVDPGVPHPVHRIGGRRRRRVARGSDRELAPRRERRRARLGSLRPRVLQRLAGPARTDRLGAPAGRTPLRPDRRRAGDRCPHPSLAVPDPVRADPPAEADLREGHRQATRRARTTLHLGGPRDRRPRHGVRGAQLPVRARHHRVRSGRTRDGVSPRPLARASLCSGRSSSRSPGSTSASTTSSTSSPAQRSALRSAPCSGSPS